MAGGVLALVAASYGLFLLPSDPLAGVPHAIAPIEDRPGPAAPPEPSDARMREVPRDTSRTGAEIEAESGVSVVRGDGTSAPGALVLRIPDEPGPIRLRPAPDARLVEATRDGTLPRIGRDGSRAAAVYARPEGGLPGGVKPTARIALLVGGLGLSEAATADALEKLPAPVTLAFAPYGRELGAQVARARELGHEVMLQVPMEPFDYPASDPGPRTLTVAAKPQDNVDNLRWMMARFPGYVGVVNFMGGKLTANETALAPLMREIGSRGLAFVDDGSSPRSLATAIGPGLRAPTARADVAIDAVPRPDAIDRELARLETQARERGFALGSASALPITLDRIGRWARALEGRRILLVPVSTAFAAGTRP
jgi:polysaccharide deacetylase 2 family uncharacterized protein YibQ